MTPPTLYRTPECREAERAKWHEGHRLCPGPGAIAGPGGGVPIEVLRCGCGCHRVRT
jgi:hypothetical protein